MINLEVAKNPNESTTSMLRRFTKKVQEAGILPRVRSIRYNQRSLSKYKVKQKTLKSIRRRAEIHELLKMGKMKPPEPRGNRSNSNSNTSSNTSTSTAPVSTPVAAAK